MSSLDSAVLSAHSLEDPDNLSPAPGAAVLAMVEAGGEPQQIDSSKATHVSVKMSDRAELPTEKRRMATAVKSSRHRHQKDEILRKAAPVEISDTSSADQDSSESASDDSSSSASETDDSRRRNRRSRKGGPGKSNRAMGKHRKHQSSRKHGHKQRRRDSSSSASSDSSDSEDKATCSDGDSDPELEDTESDVSSNAHRNSQAPYQLLPIPFSTAHQVPGVPACPVYGICCGNPGYPGTVVPLSSPLYHPQQLVPYQIPRRPRRARKPPVRSGKHRTGLASPERSPSRDPDADDSSDGSSTRKHKARKNKRANDPEFKRVDWVWDSSAFHFKLQETAESSSDLQYDDFVFHVRRIFNCENKHIETSVDIKSKLLRECLQDVMGNIEGVSLVDDTPEICPNLLFLYIDDFREHRKHLKRSKAAGDTKRRRRKHQKRIDGKLKQLKVLIEYLDKDYAKVKARLRPMLDNGLITFDLLWALWKPNTMAYVAADGSPEEARVFKVNIAERRECIMKGKYYLVEGKYFEYDGKHFGHEALSEELSHFSGARKITSLNCYPLKYHRDEARVRTQLIERGKKFVALGGVYFKSYSGIAHTRQRKGGILKFNIQTSRIMVDPAMFRRINPNYFSSTIQSDDNDCSDDEVSEYSSNERAFDSHARLPIRRLQKIEGEVCVSAAGTKDSSGEEKRSSDLKDENSPPEISDEDYMMASPFVAGFSFSEKMWLEFRVSGVKDIEWNEKAWDSLVLPPSTKNLIQALVMSRKYHATQTIDDVIQGKGKGLVTVLHGPPGTGKTLTAEGISELLKCPLYMASAGELGTDSRVLERELQKTLKICHAWGAILLLDEADVFLEKRDLHEIHRNALVCIFLRQLEYFQGILFLTTNRVETFDEAFQSRIHVALRYETLDSKARRAIFKMFIDRVRSHGALQVQQFTDEDYTMLAKSELNGREIKNVVGSAQDLAMNTGEALGMGHIKQVLDVHAKFGRDLRGAGFEDAMRSYF